MYALHFSSLDCINKLYNTDKPDGTKWRYDCGMCAFTETFIVVLIPFTFMQFLIMTFLCIVDDICHFDRTLNRS
jgi:hypothetical protein